MRRTILFHRETPTRNFSLLVLGLSALWLSLPCSSSLSQAQVPPITPSGLSTHVSDPIAVGGQTQYDITGGTRPHGGLNLFHSFGDFGVPTNNIANFLNGISFDLAGHPLAAGLPTSNILARITGSSGNNPTLSSIYGTIQTTGFENVNLFLMNPAGFLFGPNATVHVGGMVAFTSADYLRLAELDASNAGIFHADPARASVLTNAPVAAFGFLGSNPGAITVQGSQFSAKSISLVGGNIKIESGTPDGGIAKTAQLSAPNGNIL
jgi:filamentous hemagglutinin family protein